MPLKRAAAIVVGMLLGVTLLLVAASYVANRDPIEPRYERVP